ncbi:MAG: hypothetical protein A2283_20325 [Lentisphaerae bacterium RIFOXYA12_FULL_48_11]|nr:MAG: hypothetical protein A2283_20325 [Lentisphaerae bacterium RIFOXYA12_FULL_48_11]
MEHILGKDNSAISVTVIDDDLNIVRYIGIVLKKMGLQVNEYTDPEKGLKAITEEAADIVICDLTMPEMSGLDLLKKIKQISPATDVVIVTGFADKNTAIQALKFGAFDFFEKPIDSGQLKETIKRTLRYRAVVHERDKLAEQLSILSEQEAKKWGIGSFVGKSKQIRKVIDAVRKVTASTSASVLITGESGTGKELVARAIHFGSKRSSYPFVPINCPGIPADLAESILFGHIKGSFTGALSDKQGVFSQANNGTLFLDEIGDMSLAIQTKILRVLEDGVIVPVGSNKSTKVDVRIVAATNANLKEKISSGSFRKDLYYRLACFTIEMPSLKDRNEDVILLARHFAETIAAEMGYKSPKFSDEAVEILKRHNYPGNVRELRNVIERALIESNCTEIKPKHINFSLSDSSTEETELAEQAAEVRHEQPFNIRDTEKGLVRRAMEKANGNVSEAARLLGINRTKLYRKLAALDLPQKKHS